MNRDSEQAHPDNFSEMVAAIEQKAITFADFIRSLEQLSANTADLDVLDANDINTNVEAKP